MEIKRLEEGIPRGGYTSGSFFSSGNPFAGSQEFQRNFQSAYQFYQDQMNMPKEEHFRQSSNKTYGS